MLKLNINIRIKSYKKKLTKFRYILKTTIKTEICLNWSTKTEIKIS